MRRKSPSIPVIIALSLVLSMIVLAVRSLPVRADWTSWDYYADLEIRNNATTVLPAGYTVQFTLDTAALIGQGWMQTDCDDLRISHEPTQNDLDRLVEGCNTTTTRVSFQTQVDVGVGDTNTAHRLYYGNASAAAPPADPGSVYAFFDDFEDGDDVGWNATEGTWSVFDDGGNDVYRYSGGGTNWVTSYVSLPDLSDLELLARLRPSGGTDFTRSMGLAFRIQDHDNFLTFYPGRDTASIDYMNVFKYARVESDNHSILDQPSFTSTADVWHWVRIQAVGDQVRARIWADGNAEPTTWTIERSETTFQSQGSVGVTLYTHTTIADWDDVQARYLVDAEPSVALNWGNAPWWDTDWGYRIRLTVDNGSGSDELPAGYSVAASIDTSMLISQGKLLSNCDDLRVVAFNGVANTEIDRVVDGCNTTQTKVWFALPNAVASNGVDRNLYLYYGNASAPAPPADPGAVFALFDDFEDGDDAGWNWTEGAWSVFDDGGNFVYRYSGGGTNWVTSYVSLPDLSDLEFLARLRPSGGTDFTRSMGLAFRIQDQDNFLTFYPGRNVGSITYMNVFKYAQIQSDTHTVLEEPSFTTNAGVWHWVRIQAVGDQVRARIWADGTAEPTTWTVERSDTTFQSEGNVGVTLYTHTTIADWDDVRARRLVGTEPAVSSGDEETILPVPAIVRIEDTGPVEVGAPITVTAVVSATEGTVDAVTLTVLAPESADVGMGLIAGDALSGTWQATFTPAAGGLYDYRIQATSSVPRSTFSVVQHFTVADTLEPVIALDHVTDSIEVGETQVLTVTVTDNGQVDQVYLTLAGGSVPMSQHGDQYDHAWEVRMAGTITYTVTATDTVGNSGVLTGTFTSLAPDVAVCRWRDCKSGAASFTLDDGHTTCRSEMETAGFRGTYFYNGTTTQSWFATYSAAGHEVASHTASHPCDYACCQPDCTVESIWECPYTTTELNGYRQNELESNIAAIEAGTGSSVLSLAWPCGIADACRMTAASHYYLGARAFHGWYADLSYAYGTEDPTPSDFMNLRSASSYWVQFDSDLIEEAIDDGEWAIITSHGSCDGVSYIGSRLDELWAAPMGHVLQYIVVRDAAVFTNYNQDGTTISFQASHTLDDFQRQRVDGSSMSPIVFDNEVTLQVHIPDDSTLLGVEVDGTPVSYTVTTLGGARYVLFDTSLRGSRSVSVSLDTPTAVELVRLAAFAEDSGVSVVWETVNEIDLLGFNLYRGVSPHDPYTQLNSTLIQAQTPGGMSGGVYTWFDQEARSGETHYYLLEALDIHGEREFFGPTPVLVASDLWLPLILR